MEEEGVRRMEEKDGDEGKKVEKGLQCHLVGI